MRFTNAGTIRPSIHERYVKTLGCRNTTFIVPKDTNTLCRLVERIVRPNTVVVDLGCGDGIPTIHAAACGARRVLGVEIARRQQTLEVSQRDLENSLRTLASQLRRLCQKHRVHAT